MHLPVNLIFYSLLLIPLISQAGDVVKIGSLAQDSSFNTVPIQQNTDGLDIYTDDALGSVKLGSIKEASSRDILPSKNQDISCIQIDDIVVRGITLLSVSQLRNLDLPALGCTTQSEIDKLRKKILELYAQKGYITVGVTPSVIQKNNSNILRLQVVEGFVERIEGGSWWVNPNTLFPNVVGHSLNLKQLDQGLDQANRLQSNQTTLDIIPGTTFGASILRLQNQHTSPLNVIVGIDYDSAQRNIGALTAKLGLNIDSPLGLSDSLAINGNTLLGKFDKQRNIAYSILYSLPYGRVTLSTFAGQSQSFNQLALQNSQIKLDSDTQQQGMRGDYVVYRNNHQINTISFQVAHKKTNAHLNDSALETSSNNFVQTELGWNHFYLMRKGILTTNLSLMQGWHYGRNKTHQKSGFTQLKLLANMNYQFPLASRRFQLDHLFYGQYSRDLLPGSEWLDLSDGYAVRGLKNSLSADNGWYLHNTLSSRFYLFDKTFITPRVGIDFGQVVGNEKNARWQSAVSVSAGLLMRMRNVSIDFETGYGKALSEYQDDDIDKFRSLIKLVLLF